MILRALSVLEDLKVIRYLLRLDPIEGLNKLLCMNNVYLDQAKRGHEFHRTWTGTGRKKSTRRIQ
ncbi:MAG: hypothetical protein MR487_03175 [Lachnospiraceae bacterium]|nr:hypothetical protein [Lachnospiraceae bacterium]